MRRNGRTEALIEEVRISLRRPMPFGQQARCALASHSPDVIRRVKEALTADEWYRVDLVPMPCPAEGQHQGRAEPEEGGT